MVRPSTDYMKRLILPLVFLSTFRLIAFPVAAETISKWPVYNGDFSTFSLTGDEVEIYLETGDPVKYALFKDRTLPAGWTPETVSGVHAFRKAEGNLPSLPLPYHIFFKFNLPSPVVIDTKEAGRGCFVQKLSPLSGDYRLRVEIRGSPEATAELVFVSSAGKSSSGAVQAGKIWRSIEISVTVPGGDAEIRLCSDASAGQNMEFRNVVMEAVSLISSPVPFDDGSQLGGIVLSADATRAEQYACYELQRHIFRMTGRVPGLKGRDPVHKGRFLRIGRAASSGQRRRLKNQPSDSYLVQQRGAKIHLAGNSGQATLYAVYDFLKQQGCRWVTPGAEGEVIPERKALRPVENRLEIPDYDIRGVQALAQDYFLRPDGERGWNATNVDEYFDWAMRNRLNGFFFAGIRAYNFGAHRGYGWPLLGNHSYNDSVAPHTKYFDDHPEWYPLVEGERKPMCHLPPYFPNQLCVSSKGLRDYTVQLILDYFERNPQDRSFPLIPMDGPSLWCECDDCKALDPPGIDWSNHASKGSVERMTDRAVNYANEVARRVAEVHPDKRILVQAYSYTLEPPEKNMLHENVLVQYANLSGGRGRGPLGVSMTEENPIWDHWHRQLSRWKEAGASLTYYNYMDYAHPDTALFWFYSTSDIVRNLSRLYGVRAWFGETEPSKQVSFLLFHVMAETLWDVDVDYVEIIRDLCDHYYGPVADEMYDYTMLMEEAIRESDAWKTEGWTPVNHQDIPMDILLDGLAQLEGIASKVMDDPTLTRRIAYAKLGHREVMYMQTQKTTTPTAETREISRAAFDAINSIRAEHALSVTKASADRLRAFHYPEVSD